MIGILLFLLVVYYPVGAIVYSRLDDDVDLKPAPEYAIPGGSAAVAMTATLVERDANVWIANKPF